MKKYFIRPANVRCQSRWIVLCAFALLLPLLAPPLCAQDEDADVEETELAPLLEITPEEQNDDLPAVGGETPFDEDPRRFTINLRNAPLEDFFALVADQSNVRFIVRPDIEEITVTTFLPDVRLYTALSAVLTVYDLDAREVEPGILLIDRKVDMPFDPVIDLEVRFVDLKYADAEDVKSTLEPLLSEHGRIVIAQRSGYSGWEGGGGEDRRRKVESGSLIIREKEEVFERILPIVEAMDVPTAQVLISAHIVEAKLDAVRDIGIQWDINRQDFVGAVTPGSPADSVLGLRFLRLDGRTRGELEAFLQVLDEEAGANILSSPRLLTSDSQECRIMVGERFPILVTDVDSETGQRTTSLDYYEDVGVQLFIIPHIQNDSTINMVIRPNISTQVDWVQAVGEGGVVLARYPVIGTREAETQISIDDGQTIVIGGLIQEQTFETVRGVPLLKDIPLLGHLFRRHSEDKQKIDLLIFISADIIRAPEEATEERMQTMGEGIVKVYSNRLHLRAYPQEGGSGVDLTDEAPYNINEEAVLSATARPGYEFVNWTGHTGLITDGAPSDPEITVTLADEDAWFTANFRLVDYTLTVRAEPEDYGAARDRTGAEHYIMGDKARISAHPNPGRRFAGWTGDTQHLDDAQSRTALVTVPAADVSLTAVFESIDYMLGLSIEPQGEYSEKGPYNIGDQVTIKADPRPGFRFRRWEGDTWAITEGTRTDAAVVVTMPARDLELIARFEPVEEK